MCGIIGYVGNTRETVALLIKGLRRLEYRGYDSAGIAVKHNSKFVLVKKKGELSELVKLITPEMMSIKGLGIGHTRWATHGEPSDINAHPHLSNSKTLSIVHNGIIENYAILKKLLEKEGYVFESQTDTEVLVNFIEYVRNKTGGDLFEVTRLALNEVSGAYAFILIDVNNDKQAIIAKKSSPLVIGVLKNKEFIIASDSPALVDYTNEVIFMEDESIGLITCGEGVEFMDLKRRVLKPTLEKIDLAVEQLEKGGYPHFMLKEIYEQPEAAVNSMRGRLLIKSKTITLGGLKDYIDVISSANYITFLGCGTSYHACLVAKYFIEEIARLPIFVEHASEFRGRNSIILPYSVNFVISQSGETMDTLQALKMIKEKKGLVFGICNVVGSSIARETTAGTYTHAGPEIGVASTKAFTTQLFIIYMLGLWLAQIRKTLDRKEWEKLLIQLSQVPEYMKMVLKCNDKVKVIADKYYKYNNFLFLGRGINYPIALEGALKLKEISYIHAEGYPAGEMKHGPIALIDSSFPVVFICVKGKNREKTINNMIEIKARNGSIIAIATQNDKDVYSIADEVIEIPEVDELLSPLLSVIPLQLLAYHIAILRDCNVDKPRNLAKSVTVE